MGTESTQVEAPKPENQGETRGFLCLLVVCQCGGGGGGGGASSGGGKMGELMFGAPGILMARERRVGMAARWEHHYLWFKRRGGLEPCWFTDQFPVLGGEGTKEKEAGRSKLVGGNFLKQGNKGAYLGACLGRSLYHPTKI